jgi:hypothetical protein
MTKDKRQIKLDPLEWRDAMKDVGDKAAPTPATPRKKGAKAGAKKPKSR